MIKKFKEYRTFLLCLILFVFFMIFGIYAYMQKNIPQSIGGFLLGFVAFVLMSTRYKIVLFDDEMMIYEWKIAAFLPVLIPYQNIQSIQRKSKHHVMIQHQKTSHVYVFNSDQFIDAYQSMTKEISTHEDQ
ncbi:hypothetical protein [Massilimicrobiota timonensis]|uniref:hypothetical protein n=1 Tax=Massilimicrobiota timonensis TaxID=1776392 RepID=UPI001960DDCE|nr:hypothetical protein [Massilimicrobiota timonensis]MBM6965858.1 hypothetical protein [Massilimicrobiota timonensis]